MPVPTADVPKPAAVAVPKAELDAGTAALIHGRDVEESKLDFFKRAELQAAATDEECRQIAEIVLEAAAKVRA